MKRLLPFFLSLALATSLRAADQPIDWERAKALFQRSQSGEKLTDDEQKYLDEAKRQRGARDEAMREKMRGIKEKMDRGEKLTDDERRMVEEFRKRAAGAPEMERARGLFEKKQRGEKLTADEEKFLEEAGKRRMARDGGFDWERARQLNMKRESGEQLTDGEQKFLAEAMRRREAGEGPGGGRPPGAPGGGEFTWERAHAAHAKEQRGDTLSDDEKKLLAEARKRFEEGRGPDQPAAAPQRPKAGQ